MSDALGILASLQSKHAVGLRARPFTSETATGVPFLHTTGFNDEGHVPTAIIFVPSNFQTHMDVDRAHPNVRRSHTVELYPGPHQEYLEGRIQICNHGLIS